MSAPSLIPPYVLKNAVKNGNKEIRAAARASLVQSAALRKKRAKAVEPQKGEKRVVFDCKNRTTLPGTKVRDEDGPETGDIAVTEAYDAAGLTWQLYHDIYGRDSFDGKNALLSSSVHYSRDFDNAFWDGKQMVYGDGKIFNRFTADITVIGHELTHGVTEYTAGLVYQGQSGALNEHVSDVFGALTEQYAKKQQVELASWLVGAALVKGKVKGRALRDMLNPGTAYDDPIIGKDPQPAHMKDYVKTTSDNGGVHINSGIPNRAFVIAALEAGGNAWETVGRVWYRALTTLVKSNFTFAQFAASTLTASAEIESGKYTEAIRFGWTKVGVPLPSPTPTPTPTPTPVPTSPCRILDELGMDSEAIQELVNSPEYRKVLVRIRRSLRPSV